MHKFNLMIYLRGQCTQNTTLKRTITVYRADQGPAKYHAITPKSTISKNKHISFEVLFVVPRFFFHRTVLELGVYDIPGVKGKCVQFTIIKQLLQKLKQSYTCSVGNLSNNNLVCSLLLANCVHDIIKNYFSFHYFAFFAINIKN